MTACAIACLEYSRRFEHALQSAEARGLLRLPGLIAHHFVKGHTGIWRGAYAAVWVYESREAWEQLWGPLEQPKQPQEYPENWRLWEHKILAPFLEQHPDAIRFTAYEEWNRRPKSAAAPTRPSIRSAFKPARFTRPWGMRSLV